MVEKEPPEGFKPFLTSNNIKHHIIAMKGTKKESISLGTMQSILNVVLNPKNHPLLVHCNHGKVSFLKPPNHHLQDCLG